MKPSWLDLAGVASALVAAVTFVLLVISLA